MNNKAGVLPNSFTLPGIVKSELSNVGQNKDDADPPTRRSKFGQVDQTALMSRLISTPFNKASTNQRYVLDMGMTSIQKPRIKKIESPSSNAEPVVSGPSFFIKFKHTFSWKWFLGFDLLQITARYTGFRSNQIFISRIKKNIKSAIPLSNGHLHFPLNLFSHHTVGPAIIVIRADLSLTYHIIMVTFPVSLDRNSTKYRSFLDFPIVLIELYTT